MSNPYGRNDLHLLIESLGKQIERSEERLSKQIEEIRQTIESHIHSDERKFEGLDHKVGDLEVKSGQHDNNFNLLGGVLSFVGFSGLGAAIAYFIDLFSKAN